MKKFLIAAAAVALSTSAMAEWQLVEQGENEFLFQESDLGIRMAVVQLAKSGEAPADQTAAAAAKQGGCTDPQAAEIAGQAGFAFKCPNDVINFIFDDGEVIGLISGKCSNENECNALDSLVEKLTAN